MKDIDKLEILKYQLGSYSRIPWDDVRLYLDMDVSYESRTDELYEWVTCCYPNASVHTSNRCTNIKTWRSNLEFLHDVDPNTAVWLACNHDHPLITPDLSCINRVDELFATTEDIYKECQYSHWYEYLEFAARYGWKQELPGFVSTVIDTSWTQGTHIVSAALLLKWYFENNPPEDAYLPRPDWCPTGYCSIIQNNQRHKTYVPLYEWCRHFEAYYHDGTSYSEIPPLTVPEDYGISAPAMIDPADEARIRTVNFRKWGRPCPEEFINWRQI